MFENSLSKVVVVGSGAAGLSAALAAAVGGASVTVLEGSDRWGGATAVSGGQVWAPANHHMAELGIADSPEDALSYLLGQTRARDPLLAEAFVRAAPQMVEFVERHSPIRFTPMNLPDSFAEAPGGRTAGRNLEVEPIDAAGDPFWPPPFFPSVLTNEEIVGLRLMSGGQVPYEKIQQRIAAGKVTLGQGLIAGLLQGCRAAGVELLSNQRVSGVIVGVTGVRVGDREFPADRVVLATGGFEHDADLRERLLDGPYEHPLSPPVNRGDALRLAGELGASMAYLGESWSWPVSGPSDQLRLMLAERMLPHSLWVNASGRRFVNESSHNAALAFAETDSNSGRPSNVPAWAIVDAQFRAKYPFAGAGPGQPLPDYAIEAANLEELSRRTGIKVDGLTETLDRFNAYAQKGADPDFDRGVAAYDRHWGDPAAPYPNIGTVAEPPFCALPVLPGLVGTKGGLRTDARARVLRWTGEPIPGLYAAGNAMAATIGPGIVSPGATIGAALTWGWIAGSDVSPTVG
jgi:succinate dehydrogenase/fumarate reductase flavoprotein subunit